jgi:hypothetical protein
VRTDPLDLRQVGMTANTAFEFQALVALLCATSPAQAMDLAQRLPDAGHYVAKGTDPAEWRAFVAATCEACLRVLRGEQP